MELSQSIDLENLVRLEQLKISQLKLRIGKVQEGWEKGFYAPEEVRTKLTEHREAMAKQDLKLDSGILDRKGAARVDETKVTCPVLVVAGGRDRITPASVVRRIHNKYRAVSTYKKFPNHAHWVIEEPRWQEVAKYVSDWLDRVLSQGS